MQYTYKTRSDDTHILGSKSNTPKDLLLPWLVDKTPELVLEAQSWQFNKGWDLFGIKEIIGTNEDSSRKLALEYVKYVLKIIHDKIPDEAEFVRINVIVMDDDKNKTTEPFRLSDYDNDRYLNDILNSFFERYEQYESSGRFKVLIIGKRNAGRISVDKILNEKIKLDTKQWAAVRAWPKYAQVKGLTDISNFNNVAYGSYDNGTIVEVLNTRKGEYTVKLFAASNITNVEVLKASPKYLESYTFPSDMTEVSAFEESQSGSDVIRYVGTTKHFFKVTGNLLTRVKTTRHVRLSTLNAKSIKAELLNVKFGVIDLETYFEGDDKNRRMKTYAMGVHFSDELNKSFYIDGYESGPNQVELMMKDCLEFIVASKIKLLYAHNAGKFDNILIAQIVLNLSKLGVEVNCQGYKEGNSIPELEIVYKKTTITIKDSLKLMPQSLASLCKSYGIKDKGVFPHNFINESTVCYEGPKPAYEYFHGMTLEDYSALPETVNIKTMALEYMMWDCKALYTVLTSFRAGIHNVYKIDPLKNQTISGVAYKIWHNLTLNMPEIARIANNTKIARDIRESYYGGIAEVYAPSVGISPTGNVIGSTNVNYYDVNSLYPAAMVKFKMPLGSVVYVENANLEDVFGFCYVRVEAPALKRPILPTRIGSKTMLVSGTWSGWYFSEELKNALDYGYKFEVLKAYDFKKTGYIFTEYIQPIYDIKGTTKDPVERAISKLLLNSLYGMMGFRGDGKSQEAKISKGALEIHKLERVEGHNTDYSINVAIAAAVTSYARILMTPVRNLSIYSDTDSALIEGYLAPDLVSDSELGKFKHEFGVKLAIMPAAKTYGFETVKKDSLKVQIKIASSGIKEGLVSIDDLISILKDDPNVNINGYTYKAFKPLIEKGELKIVEYTIVRKTSNFSEARVRINFTDSETKTSIWIGTMAWRVDNHKLMHPKDYFTTSNCTFIPGFNPEIYDSKDLGFSESAVAKTIKKYENSGWSTVNGQAVKKSGNGAAVKKAVTNAVNMSVDEGAEEYLDFDGGEDEIAED